MLPSGTRYCVVHCFSFLKFFFGLFCCLSFVDLRFLISTLVSSKKNYNVDWNKDNNKITELRTILQRQSQNS